MSTAAKVAALKRQHPENYCADPRCLWRTYSRGEIRPCPKHPVFLSAAAPELLAALREIAEGKGPFSRDPLKHAENTIESIKEIARAAIAKATGAAL